MVDKQVGRPRRPRDRPNHERISPEEWEKRKPRIHRLYVKKRLPLPQVISKMKQKYRFDASSKQYRYRIGEIWKWPRYGAKGKQALALECASTNSSSVSEDMPDTLEAVASLDTPSGESESALTPSGSDDDEDNTSQHPVSVLNEFLAVFYEDSGAHQASASNPMVENPFGAYTPITIENAPESFRWDTTLPADNLNIGREQSRYAAFDGVNPQIAYSCLSPCLEWCEKSILVSQTRAPKSLVPGPFNRLGTDSKDDDPPNTYARDKALFVYLWDRWAFPNPKEPSQGWARLALTALGITPSKLLLTMASLILTYAGADAYSDAREVRRRSPRLNCANQEVSWLFHPASSGIRQLKLLEPEQLVDEFSAELAHLGDPEPTFEAVDKEREEVVREMALRYAERVFGSVAGEVGLRGSREAVKGGSAGEVDEIEVEEEEEEEEEHDAEEEEEEEDCDIGVFGDDESMMRIAADIDHGLMRNTASGEDGGFMDEGDDHDDEDDEERKGNDDVEVELEPDLMTDDDDNDDDDEEEEDWSLDELMGESEEEDEDDDDEEQEGGREEEEDEEEEEDSDIDILDIDSGSSSESEAGVKTHSYVWDG
ncbi:hypothetical protein F4778DRAFT_76655 [Xylariomycetidae sp. FL2044]|nr:hypothetical protein F4778DRAFT_76655 [Xylariomycetidae sp. FL2044]